MLTDQVKQRIAWLETAILLFSSPFLLFTDIFPGATILAMLLVLGGWVLCWKFYRFPLPSSPFNTALLALGLMVLVGVLISADRELTLPKALGLFLGFAAWRLIALHAKNDRGIWIATFAFAVVGLGMIVLGILSANWRFRVDFVETLFRFLPPQLIGLPQAADQGVHTNQLAGTLLYYLVLPIAFLLDWRSYKSVRAYLIPALLAALLLVGLLLLTQSRSAWMGAVAGIMFLLILWSLQMPPGSKARRVSWAVLAIGSGLAVALLVSFWPTVLAALYEEPPTSTPIGTLETLSFRYEVWRWAVAAINDFPFTGTGLGSFRRVVLRLYPIEFGVDFAHAHNIFLQVALDVGLPGLISYVSTLVLAFVAAWRTAAHSSRLRPLALGLASGLVAVHVYGLTDALALGSKTAIAFWMILGLLTASWNLVSAHPYPAQMLNTISEVTHVNSTHHPPHPLQTRRRLLPTPGPVRRRGGRPHLPQRGHE